MQRIVVLLPEPFGPRKPVTRPGCTSNDKSSTASVVPNRFVRFLYLDHRCIRAGPKGSHQASSNTFSMAHTGRMSRIGRDGRGRGTIWPMFLALKEMRRAKVRFGMLIAAIGLLVFLILFQQSLQNGLLTSFVGAIRNQSAPVLVYSVDGQRIIQGSIITPDLEQIVAQHRRGRQRRPDRPGHVHGRLGHGRAVRHHDHRLRDPSSSARRATLVAGRYPSGPAKRSGVRPTPTRGSAWATEVVVEPGGDVITIVGLAAGRAAQRRPDAVRRLRRLRRPRCVRRTPTPAHRSPTSSAVAPAAGVTAPEVVANINARSTDLDALTRSDAADQTPGVSQVRQSFHVIFLLYGLVVPCVTGLFFLIITFQKSGALTLLRAIGAPARRLVSALLVQVVIIVAAGFVIGLALYTPSRSDGSAASRCVSRRPPSSSGRSLLLVLGIAQLAARGPPGAGDRPDRGDDRRRQPMKLALRELVRRPGRFVTATVILTLIAMLLMFLGGLLDGLIRSSTGAVRAQRADALVYSETSQASFLRSRIEPAQRAAIANVAGVSDTGGSRRRAARRPGAGQRAARPRQRRRVGLRARPVGRARPAAAGRGLGRRVLQAERRRDRP